MNLNPFDAAATMSAYIAYIAQGDIPVTSIDYKSVFAVGSLLFLLTFALNAVLHPDGPQVPGGVRVTSHRPSAIGRGRATT